MFVLWLVCLFNSGCVNFACWVGGGGSLLTVCDCDCCVLWVGLFDAMFLLWLNCLRMFGCCGVKLFALDVL